MTDPVELYRKYRPSKLSEVVGQKDALKALTDMGKRKAIPHALLFVGPSGCGKTTLARIIRTKIKCGDRDFVEVNSADFRGIDSIRSIRQQVGLAPISGACRVWLIDEVHQLTPAAQDAFLKILEDTPPHVYFMLATTDPQKLKKTIRTRCTEIKCKNLTVAELEKLVTETAAKESVTLGEDVAEKLAATADGSARKALVLLHAIIGLQSDAEQLAAIEAADSEAEVKFLGAALMNRSSTWPAITKILKGTEAEPETLRWGVLGYCRNILLGSGGNAARAAAVIDEFRDNFYDSKAAGLAAACYAVIHPAAD